MIDLFQENFFFVVFNSESQGGIIQRIQGSGIFKVIEGGLLKYTGLYFNS